MTASHHPFAEKSDGSLIAKIRQGDEEAASGLYRRYADRILGLVKSQMGGLLRSGTEPEDIVQSVFKSVFRGVNSGAYEAPDGQSIWQLLAVIAVHKVRRKGRNQLAACRDARKTVEMDPSETPGLAITGQEIEVHVRDVLEKLDLQDRAIVEMRLEGHTVEEIADRLARSRRTVERSLQRIREQLGKHLELEDQ